MTSSSVRLILATANVKKHVTSLSLKRRSCSLVSSPYHNIAALPLQTTSNNNNNKQQEPSSSTPRYRHYNNNIIIHRNQSTSSPSNNNDKGGSPSDQKTASTASQFFFFPWRHSPNPPTRLLHKDDYSGMPNNVRARFVRKLIAARELNLSIWDVLPIPFYKHEWEEELAKNFSVAFGLAISELGRTVFPKGMVRYEDQCVWIDNMYDDTTIATTSLSSSSDDDDDDDLTKRQLLKTNNSNHDKDIHKNNAKSENSSFPKRSNDNNTSIESNDYLNLMMDRLLLEQYQHLINNNNNNIHIKLSLKPIQAKLEHIFAIPLLTREIVLSKPHLKGAYQRLEATYKQTKSYTEVKRKTYELAEEVGLKSAQRTVIAEATITCLEYFQVKDTSNNVVLQGMEGNDDDDDDIIMEGEEVVHLVRFEVVTDRGEDGKREIGNWKLIDIDDLLEGNVFH
jgi:hypothetical protein